jgi:hypothetical protein
MPSVSPGDSASQIKSALAAYDRGRRSAEEPGADKTPANRHDENEEQS